MISRTSLPPLAELLRQFPTPAIEEWKQIIEQDAKGTSKQKRLTTSTPEGIELKALYTSDDLPHLALEDVFPGIGSFARGANPGVYHAHPWYIAQQRKEHSLTEAAQCIAEGIAGGENAISLLIGNTTYEDPPGLRIVTVDDLHALCKGVDLAKVPLFIQSGFLQTDIISLLKELCKKRSLSQASITGFVAADEFSSSALIGALPSDTAEMILRAGNHVDLMHQEFPGMRSLLVDSEPYHNAGATATQEIAFSITSGVELLSSLATQKRTAEKLAGKLTFRLAIGPHFFMEIAKVRALRRLWTFVLTQFGIQPNPNYCTIHITTSGYHETLLDKHVNILRATTEAIAATISGVQLIDVKPYTHAEKKTDELSRRVARNVQTILREESHFDHVIDPAGGSYYVESLTSVLAEKSWDIVQKIEQGGGFLAALKGGFIQHQCAESASVRLTNVKKRKHSLIGTNAYPNLKDTIPSIASRPFHPPFGISIPALSTGRLAEAFEAIRRRALVFELRHGRKPTVHLLAMGSPKQHRGRADFSRSFFEIGGFAVEYPKGYQGVPEALEGAQASCCDAIVICSTDETYPELVPSLTGGAKKVNPSRPVILAGYPKDHVETFSKAGVDDFIFLGCDAHHILHTLLTRLGV